MGKSSTLALFIATGALGCGGADYDEPVPETVAALVPSGLTLHAENAAGFQFEGREVRLTHVEYGELMDCPAGCFASHVCAIEDGADVLLFYAYWTAPGEAPLDLSSWCPGLDPSLASSTTQGGCEPEGKSHPLVMTAEFADFLEGQVGSGPFRWCVE